MASAQNRPESQALSSSAKAQSVSARFFPSFWRERTLVWQDWQDFFRACLTLEQDMRRLFLFVPVAMVGGVLLYVQADREPSWLAPLILAGVSGGLAFLNRDRNRVLMVCLIGLCAMSTGFLAACLQTIRLATPVLQKPWIGYASGVIEQIDWGQDNLGQDNAHLILRVYKMGFLTPSERPVKLKLSVKGKPAIKAGDQIFASMRVQPLPGPSYAGGYDFRFDYFFKQIGGVGTIVGEIKAGYGKPPSLWQSVWFAIDRYRCAITDRIYTVIGGQNGAVAAALVTGKRGYINEHSNDSLRSAGIYHVVSISGLHMAIAAGFAFTCARLFFLLIPGLSLRHDTRRWAAWAGMAGAVVYDVFAGSDIATERSMLMTLVLFGAIAFGRRLLSMRNCALAAMLLIVLEPNGVLNPGFQMSFAAVVGLIALYERKPDLVLSRTMVTQVQVTEQSPQTSKPKNRFFTHHKMRALFNDVVLTTVVAELATAPFGLYHFHMMQSYGLIGNAITLPFVSFIVMPAAALGLIAMPFGLDAPIWTLMGYGMDAIMRICDALALWPAATRYMAGFSVSALLLMVSGFLILCLLISPLRYGALVLALAGAFFAYKAERPEVYIGREGRFVAVRMADGRLQFAGLGLNAFSLSQIARQDGDGRLSTDPTLIAQESCAKKSCRLTSASGLNIELVWDEALLSAACQRADLVVTSLTYQKSCQAQVIDRVLLQQQGAVQGFIRNGTVSLVTDRSPLRARPWAP